MAAQPIGLMQATKPAGRRSPPAVAARNRRRSRRSAPNRTTRRVWRWSSPKPHKKRRSIIPQYLYPRGEHDTRVGGCSPCFIERSSTMTQHTTYTYPVGQETATTGHMIAERLSAQANLGFVALPDLAAQLIATYIRAPHG